MPPMKRHGKALSYEGNLLEPRLRELSTVGAFEREIWGGPIKFLRRAPG